MYSLHLQCVLCLELHLRHSPPYVEKAVRGRGRGEVVNAEHQDNGIDTREFLILMLSNEKQPYQRAATVQGSEESPLPAMQ